MAMSATTEERLIRHPLGFLIDPDAGIIYGRYGRPVGSRDTRGYLQLDCRTRGLGMVSHHRMIWESVHGPIPPGLEINHLNGIHDDNRIANLELVTCRENILHAYRTGLKSNAGERHPYHKVTDAEVREMRRLRDQGLLLRQIAPRFGLSLSHISAIVTGRSWTHVPMEETA